MACSVKKTTIKGNW